MKWDDIVDRFVKTLRAPKGQIEELFLETGLMPGDPVEKAYLDKGGMQCPFCHAKDSLQAGAIDEGEGVFYQNIFCTACRKEWTDSYTLTGMTYEDGPQEFNAQGDRIK
jgi:hypothetical protein